jgi:exosome complex exonuclease RRP6
MDIMWLQRDFGLYVVNLFDTYYASKALSFPKHGLAYLLETYAHFETSKKYQLADWRIRPLPAEMLSYARADTHFLLYIYDKLRNRLLEDKKLERVLKSSREVAAQKYETPSSHAGLSNILGRYNLTDGQAFVLEKLYNWRDGVARRADESPRFIVPNHYLVALSVGMPTSVSGVLSAATGATSHIRSSAKEILSIIDSARSELDERVKEGDSPQDVAIVDSSHAEFDYPSYQSLYSKAVAGQKHLFGASMNDRTSVKLNFEDSRIFKSENKESNVDYIARLKLIRGDLQLHIQTPPADDKSGESDMDDDSVENEVDVDEPAPIPSLKRKSEDEESSLEEPGEDEEEAIVATEENQQSEPRQKSRSRSSRKKRKLKLLDLKDMDEFDGVEREQTPALKEPSLAFNAFDYRSQDKVLSGPSKLQRTKKKPSFNPYGSLSGAPVAAKSRIRKQKTPSSFTFKKK